MVIEHLRAGNVRFLTIYSDKRYRTQQHVPTAVELGYPEAAVLRALGGLYIHRRTPDSIQKYLLDVLKKIYDDPEFAPAIEKMVVDLAWGDPEYMNRAIKSQAEIGVPLLKELGMYVDQ